MSRALVLASFLLASCIVQEPPGPTTVVVTVAPWPSGVGSPAELCRGGELALELDRSDAWKAAAQLLVSEPLADEWIAQRRIPGDADCVAEALLHAGFETGAILSGDLFDEPSGMLQGFVLLDEPWLREAALADPGARGAAFAGAQFVSLKIPRPLEDGAFAWIHLDLSGVDDAAQVLVDAMAGIDAALAADPAAVLVLASLDPAASGAHAALRCAATPGAGPTDPALFGAHLRAAMAASRAEVVQ